MMCLRATEREGSEFQTRFLLIDVLCRGLTSRMVSLAAHFGEEAGFLGSWDFAVGLTGVRNVISWARFSLLRMLDGTLAASPRVG